MKFLLLLVLLLNHYTHALPGDFDNHRNYSMHRQMPILVENIDSNALGIATNDVERSVRLRLLKNEIESQFLYPPIELTQEL
jgi:hypothetical protein